jgi:glycogenin glucosyltransferase
MASNPDQAWVTLATNDSYALGGLVLSHSLRKVETTRKIVIMITDGVTDAMKSQLTPAFDEVINVKVLDSNDAENLELLERPDLGITFTKLHCWKLVHYSKCVFLDADTLILKNCDELFDRDEFSAAPDAGWPDCFNSGVFVFRPSIETFKALITHAGEQGSFDGGDQGLLNTFFDDWATKDISKHLPFLYNMVATATYTYIPAYKHYGHKVKIVHFIGATKPWHVKFDVQGQPQAGPLEAHTLENLKHWWQIFHSEVKPKLAELAICRDLGIPYEPIGHDHTPGQSFGPLEHGFIHPTSEQPSAAGQHVEASGRPDDRGDWESGRPDFMGRAAFDNIRKKIDESVNSPKTDH